MKFAFQVAFRFLKSSLGQNILIVLGISVGVSVQVFIGSLIGGLQQDLVNTTIGNSSQITIESSDDTEYISDYVNIENTILQSVDGIRALSFALDTPGSLIEGTDTEPILLRGLSLDKAEGIYEIEEKIVAGVLPSSINEILVGQTLLDDMGLALNDTITVSVPLIGDTDMEIVGVYDFKVSSINSLWVLTTLETAQDVLGEGTVVSSIEMQLDDVFVAEELANEINTSLNNNDIVITNWIEQNGELLTGLEAQSSSSLMIQVFVTISVIIGITSVLAITVIQKSKQIGILKAMGLKDKEASLIFLSEGIILGIFGAIGGVLLGLFLSWAFSTFALDASGEPVVPLLIDPTFIVISALVALFSASLASVIPARRSSRLSVIEVIRNG
jgi:lipoprotein-releasing system permease protein